MIERGKVLRLLLVLQSILLPLFHGSDLLINGEVMVSKPISNQIHSRMRQELSIVSMGPEKMTM